MQEASKLKVDAIGRWAGDMIRRVYDQGRDRILGSQGFTHAGTRQHFILQAVNVQMGVQSGVMKCIRDAEFERARDGERSCKESGLRS